MKTRNELYQLLSDALSSKTWQQLKKSLVGKELLAFGTEVLTQNEVIKESIFNLLNPEESDFSSLLKLAEINDVAISRIEPSVIRISINSPTERLYKPFDLKFSIGNITFTNVAFVKSTDTITLYQGQVRHSFNNSTQPNISGFRYDLDEVWRIETVLRNSSIKRYINLGNALIDSVWFYQILNGVPAGLNRYSPLFTKTSSSDTETYKLRSLKDGSIVAELGDGVWGKDFVENEIYEIIWLSLTNEPFSAEGGTLTSATWGQVQDFEITDSVQGSTNLDYARLQLKSLLSKQTSICTLSEIKNFVNSFPYVLDCSVSLHQDYCEVFVKPRDPESRGFYGDIEAALNTFGLIFREHFVKKGDSMPLSLVIRISDSEYSDEAYVKALIKDLISKSLSYENLKFDYILDTAQISSLIQSNLGISTFVRLKIRETKRTSLTFLPIQDTFKVYDSNNELVAWDSSGVIYGKGNQLTSKINTISLGFAGNFIWYAGSDINYLLNIKSWTATEFRSFILNLFPDVTNLSSLNIDVQSTLEAIIFIVTLVSSTTKKYVVGFNYTEMWNTIQGVSGNPTPFFKAEMPLGFPIPSAVYNSMTYKPHLFYHNGLLYWIVYSKTCILYVGRIVNGSLSVLYLYDTGSTNSYVSVLRKDRNLFIFHPDFTATVIKNFTSSNYEILKGVPLDFGESFESPAVLGTVFREKYDGNILVSLVEGRDASAKKGTNKIFVYKDLELLSNKIYFSGKSELMQDMDKPMYTDAYPEGMSYRPLTITDDFVVVQSGGPSGILYSYFVDLKSGSYYTLDFEKSPYSLARFGSISYAEGSVDYSGLGVDFEYESTTSKGIASSTYLVLDSENPIIWN